MECFSGQGCFLECLVTSWCKVLLTSNMCICPEMKVGVQQSQQMPDQKCFGAQSHSWRITGHSKGWDCRRLEKANKIFSCSAEKWQVHLVVHLVCTAIVVFVLLASPYPQLNLISFREQNNFTPCRTSSSWIILDIGLANLAFLVLNLQTSIPIHLTIVHLYTENNNACGLQVLLCRNNCR